MRILSIGGGNKTPMLRDAISVNDVTNVLIVPTACSTVGSYNKKVPLIEQLFAEELGMPSVKTLHHFDEQPSTTQIEAEFGAAELVYVIGGNTPWLMKTLALHGTDKAIRSVTANDSAVLAGTSAGALLPFQKAMVNPARQPAKESWDFQFIDGLGMIPAAATAHANQHDPMPGDERHEQSRSAWFFEHLGQLSLSGIAIDNNAALIIDGHTASIGRSDPSAHVRVGYVGADDAQQIMPVQDSESIAAWWQALNA